MQQQPVDDTVQRERENRRQLWWRVVRWIIAIPLILFSYPYLGFFGPFVMLFGVILIARDIAGYLSQFVGRLIWPQQQYIPHPLYSIAESLTAKGKYAEAEKEYEKIIEDFPDAVKPHLDMINIAIVRMHDGPLAEKLYHRGLSVLKNEADRDTLTRMYKAIRTRLKKMPAKI